MGIPPATAYCCRMISSKTDVVARFSRYQRQHLRWLHKRTLLTEASPAMAATQAFALARSDEAGLVRNRALVGDTTTGEVQAVASNLWKFSILLKQLQPPAPLPSALNLLWDARGDDPSKEKERERWAGCLWSLGLTEIFENRYGEPMVTAEFNEVELLPRKQWLPNLLSQAAWALREQKMSLEIISQLLSDGEMLAQEKEKVRRFIQRRAARPPLGAFITVKEWRAAERKHRLRVESDRKLALRRESRRRSTERSAARKKKTD